MKFRVFYRRGQQQPWLLLLETSDPEEARAQAETWRRFLRFETVVVSR